MNFKQKNTGIALRWIEAFNEQNVNKILALYHEEASHFSPRLMKSHPVTKGLIIGQEAMRDWWTDSFNRLPTLRYRLLYLDVNEQEVLMTYERIISKTEKSIVEESLEIKEGMIVKSKVY